jgi:hypothetical protein
MADMSPRSRRIVGLALLASAGFLLVTALVIYTGLLPVGDEIKGTVAAVLGAVAAVDLLLGFWFFRSSLSG